MASFSLPVRLVDAVRSDGTAERSGWLARLPATVQGLADRWSLTLGPPFQPGGVNSWVAPARDRAGRDLVIKVAWRHAEGEHEAAGLRVWAGRGAVHLHDVHVDSTTIALLLERCRPGGALEFARSGPEQDEIVAGLLRGLWSEPPAGHPFRSLVQMCDDWADEFETSLAAEPDALDPGLARAGTALFRELPRAAGTQRLLVTDLHAGNILAARREPWLVVDPKPHVGDPAYDVLQHMLNCRERLVADPRGLARRMAGLAGLDAERVQRWLFARAVQECLEWRWLLPVVTDLAPA
ncbi:aminoglycoside phosphotransferase family protein [Pseudonocardia alaniniphila]|uniref:Aminoglycoside phosphotransferase family protein n=1 Tax=Pseudonocardia alaniniphila TaxID=75291 RepID=A0ABS9TDV0_9PSEU|nr:aminoglycoside phosphotransferase family protein [Pseudonocardia alaniniphila]MCH6166573.1 aminoglycoside phosphotransferase family protein [Pseudonocardia alaniniphila]